MKLPKTNLGKYSSRRKFLNTTLKASLLTVSATGLTSFNINSKYTSKKGKVVGHGDFKYRVNKEWVTAKGKQTPIDHCHEMVEDSKGRLIMTTTHKANNVIIYNKDGNVLKSWGTEYPGAHGLTLSDEGGEEFLFITDPDHHKVVKTTLDGKVLMTLGHPEMIPGYDAIEKFKPTEVAVAPNGDFYVADGYGLDYIIQYDSKGEYIRHFAGKVSDKNEPEKVSNAHGVCMDLRDANNPYVLVTSRAKQQFKKYTLDGKYLETYDTTGASICRPVIKGQNLYFSVLLTKSVWHYDGIVLVLDKNNKVVSVPGGEAPKYEGGKLNPLEYDGDTFLHPHDVCVDGDENIYVTQWHSGRTFPVMLERI